MTVNSLPKKWAVFIRMITFVDLPIKKKIQFFSFGALFWFFLMAATAIFSMMHLNKTFNKVIYETTPYDRGALKISNQLSAISYNMKSIIDAKELGDALTSFNDGRENFTNIKTILETLLITPTVKTQNSKNIKTLKPTNDKKVINDIIKLRKTTTELSYLYHDIASSHISHLRKNDSNKDKSTDTKLKNFNSLQREASDITNSISNKTTTLYTQHTSEITFNINHTTSVIVFILVIETILLVVFSIWISRALTAPINAIITQIDSLSTNNVDLTRKIEITTKDEIGVLAEKFNNLMESVHKMGVFKKVIEEDDSLDDVYSRLNSAFIDYVHLDKCTIYEIDSRNEKMKVVIPVISDPNNSPCNEVILERAKYCRAIRTGHPVSSISYNGVCKQFFHSDNKCHVCMPMHIGGRPGGVIQFLFDKPNNDKETGLINNKIFRADAFINQALSVIEAKRLMNTLRESALRDPLTGLYNRRFLQEHTNHLLAGVVRRKKSIGLIMCDLDYFKQVNDSHGHDAGDIVLKRTSILITESVRKSDLVIRFGGEEFLVLLIDVQENEAVAIAEKIRKNIEQTKFKVSDGTITKTISLGVSEYPSDTDGFWQAIKFADVALYKAKDDGRNKTIRFDTSMWTENEF